MNKRYTLEAAEKLSGSELPILLTWAPGDRFFPIRYAERLAGEARTRASSGSPTPSTFVAARPAAAPRRRDRDVRRAPKLRQNRASCAFFFALACFSSDRGAKCSVQPPYRTESHAQGDLRPGSARSTMAQRLDEAFAGCDQWTLAPPTQRRSEARLQPAAPRSPRGSAAAPPRCGPRSRGAL